MKRKVLRVLAGIGGLGIAFCIALGTSAVAVFAETEYEYDDLNRLTEERHDDGTVIYYSYDANGNLLDVEVKDGSDTENEKPDEGSDHNSGGNFGGNQSDNAGGQEGTDLGNSGNHDGERNPEHIGNGENGKSEGSRSDSGQENASENREENGIKDPSENSREGTGGSGFGSGVGDEKAEGASENPDGSGSVIAKALTVLVVLIAAVSRGIFIWKRRKKNEKGEDDD